MSRFRFVLLQRIPKFSNRYRPLTVMRAFL